MAENAANRGALVRILRWLAAEMARDGYPLAHVPQQVAARLLDDLDGSIGCKRCGEALPAPARTGRPRTLCLACRPRRRAKLTQNDVIGA
jgi:formylmethanofuran dehydrogenase subunit E